MKKALTLLLICLTLFANAQYGMLNGSGDAPDITVTDINGNTHNLYNYLDSGKVVVLELMSVTCGHCQSHAAGTENSYQTNGPSGTNVARFLGLEVNAATDSAAVANFASTFGVTFPIANNVSPAAINYQLYYTPGYYIIYPDRSYTTICALYCVTAQNYSTIEGLLNTAIAAWVPPVYGCTDSLAVNYNPLATVDNDSCDFTSYTIKTIGMSFSPDTIICDVGDTINFILGGYHNAVEVSDSTWLIGGTTSNGGFSFAYGATGMFIPDQCHTYYYVCQPHASSGMKGVIIAYHPPVFGCTDSTATNYNPLATIDDSSCTYLCDSLMIIGVNVPAGSVNGGIIVSSLPTGTYLEIENNPFFTTVTQSNTTITSLSPGTYYYCLYDDSDSSLYCCDSLVISPPPSPCLISLLIDTLCSTGTISVTATGGSGNYIYNWSNGSNTSSVSNLTNGFYCVEVMDANDPTCKSDTCISFDCPPPPSPCNLSLSATDTCYNGASINLTVSGGSGFYAYNWDNGATTEDLSGLSDGIYCVIVNDAFTASCIDTLCITVGCDTCISIADPGFENSVNTSTLDDWSISHGTPTNGPPAYMGNNGLYLWSGGNTPTGEGVYTCFNFDTTKCYDISFYAHVEDSSKIAIFELAQTSSLTPNTNFAIPTVPSSSIHSEPFSSMGSNWAQITISGYQPPQNDDQFWIYPLYVNGPGAARIWIDEIYITEASCCLSSDTLNLSTGYDIINQQLVSPPSNDPNWVLVTSPNPSTTLNVPAHVIAPLVGTWHTNNNASWISEYITSGPSTAQGLYQFQNCFCLSQADSVSINLLVSADNYAEVSLLSDYQTSSQSLTTFGTLATGSPSSNFITQSQFTYNTYLGVGEHCIVADLINYWSCPSYTGLKIEGSVYSRSSSNSINNCCDTCIYGCTNPNAFNYNPYATCDDGSCPCDVSATSICSYDSILGYQGSIFLTATGGSGSYLYNWSNGANTQNLSGLANGTYYVTVTDSVSCIDSLYVTIACDTCNISATVICSYDTISGNSISDICLSPTGGSGGYLYNWSNGASSQGLHNIPDGIYCVTATDLNNISCLDSLCVTVACDTCNLTLSTTDTCLNATNSGEIDLTVTGGSGSYSYYWTGPNGYTSTLGDISGLAIGTYCVIVTDVFNSTCIDTLCITVDCDTCPCGDITGIYISDIIDHRATFNWNNMNTNDCEVDQIRIKYREVFSNGTYGPWQQKTIGSPADGISCNVQNTYKKVLNLSASTTYEYKFKVWWCCGLRSGWHGQGTFTTLPPCDNVTNLTITSGYGNPNKARADWINPVTHSFVQLQYKASNSNSWSWFNSNVPSPLNFDQKWVFTSGVTYNIRSRTGCSTYPTPYKSTWSAPITWQHLRISQDYLIQNLDMYPNPTSGEFFVNFQSEDVQDIEIRFTNTIGKTIYFEYLGKFIGEYTHRFNISEYSKGVYFLEIKTDNGIVNKKLILQ